MKTNPFLNLLNRTVTEICSERNRDAGHISHSAALTLLVGSLTTHSADAAFLHKPTIATLKQETSQTNGDVAFVLGYYGTGDRGGGWFTWQSGTTNADDGGRYLAPESNSATGRWARVFSGETVNVKMWGAAGDGRRNDTTNIQNAVNACHGLTLELLFPYGTYLVTNTIVFRAEQLHLRGELARGGPPGGSCIHMPPGIQKDILRSVNADNALNGRPSDFDHYLLVENLNLAFEGKEKTRNAQNACLVICRPGEANTIRNIMTESGAYGIRCLAAGSPGLNLRDVSLNDAAVAGVSVEPLPGQNYASGGPISFIGISGDHRWDSSASNACLMLFSNCVAVVNIQDVKAEAAFGGGLIHHRWPDPATGWDAAKAMGSLNIRNVSFDGGPSYGGLAPPLDLIVLRGGQRTASVLVEMVNLVSVRYLIRDEVSDRNIDADVNTYNGLSQLTARTPLAYEAFDLGSSSYPNRGKLSRLTIGQTAISYFTPKIPGWYRVMMPMNAGRTRLAGNLVISCYATESTELQVDINTSSGVPYINVARPTYDNGKSPAVTRARAFRYWDNDIKGYWAYVDIKVERILPTGQAKLNRIMLASDINGMEMLGTGMIQLLPPYPVSSSTPAKAVVTDVPIVR